MKLRLLVAGLVAAASFPMSGAHAGQCETPIYLFSFWPSVTVNGVDDPRNPGHDPTVGIPTATSSAIGCTVLGSDDPNTDWIYPGTVYLSVRFLLAEQPLTATLSFAGKTYDLNMQRGFDLTGAPQSWYDSDAIRVSPVDTSAPGNLAVVTICADEGEGEPTCYQRTYRTMTTA